MHKEEADENIKGTVRVRTTLGAASWAMMEKKMEEMQHFETKIQNQSSQKIIIIIIIIIIKNTDEKLKWNSNKTKKKEKKKKALWVLLYVADHQSPLEWRKYW